MSDELTNDPLSKLRSLSDQSQSKRNPCAVARALKQMPVKDARLVEAGLAESPVEAVKAGKTPITNKGVADFIASFGVKVHWQAVRNHRKKACACNGD